MIKNLYLAVVAVILVACGSNIEEKAQGLVDQAQAAYTAHEYGRAKALLDSVKSAYPKAFKARREALRLSREVEMSEQRRSLEYYNSRMGMLEARRDSMLQNFTFNKEGRYQDVGYYTASAQSAKRGNDTYLRAQVDENGIAMLTSIYRGKAMSHNSVRVSNGDTFAECETPFSNYTSKHLGVTTERLDFRYGQDGGLMDFVAAAKKPVSVCLKGNGEYSYTLSHEDVASVALVVELATVLQAIDSLKDMRDEAERHINFLIRSKKKYEADDDDNDNDGV